MMPTIAPPSVLSAPQRRCQVLLTLFQPEPIATVEIFSALNGVDDDTAREDSLRQAWRSSAIIALPSQHARTVAIGSKVQHSISAFAFYTGSGAACVYARPSSRNSLPRP